MGTDIHLIIEKKKRSSNVEKWETCGIIGDGECWFARNYDLFHRLYGIPDKRVNGYQYVVPVRGFPQDAAWSAVEKYGLIVSKDAKFDFEVTPELAELYVNENKYSHYFESEFRGKRTLYVSNPDFHNANWITADELEKVLLDECSDWKYWNEEPDEWYVLLQTMRLYESTNQYEVRAIYWFDN